MNEKNYLYGGRSKNEFGNFAPIGNCDEYNPIGDSWQSVSDMLSPFRSRFSSSSMNQNGYVYGGTTLVLDQIANCASYQPI